MSAGRPGLVEPEADGAHARGLVEDQADDLLTGRRGAPPAALAAQGALDRMRGILGGDLHAGEPLEVETVAGHRRFTVNQLFPHGHYSLHATPPRMPRSPRSGIPTRAGRLLISYSTS